MIFRMRVLGIETSCDETGVAIYDTDEGLVADELYSQAAAHAAFGGVLPELASRDHVRKLAPLTRRALESAGLEPGAIDGVAYTAGPGLVGALMVGAAFAAGLARAWRVPALPVHHMEGHLLAPLLEDPGPDSPRPDFPFVALLVSGGHTMLVEARGLGDYRQLGTTLDDAAGEAFDKTAKLLGLGYPGGAALAKLAEGGDPAAWRFPRPMLGKPGLDFSFSGLKTAVALAIRDAEEHGSLDGAQRADIAASFQAAVVDTLVEKSLRALDAAAIGTLIVAGGVGANARLREALESAAGARGARVCFPRPAYCTDNGAMIAYTGALRLHASGHDGGIVARARWPIESLEPVAPRASRTSRAPQRGEH